MADSRSPGARPSITADATAHEILESARDLPAVQRVAIGGWLSGLDYDQIAVEQGLPSRKHAERAVRAALEALRRRFRREDEP